ncbi:hypothetical protein OSTOST_07492, partial [Ostertagia ostertagi]
CICEPGFKPPYCEAPADACFNHLCINGAQCVAKSPFNYEYVTCFTNNENSNIVFPAFSVLCTFMMLFVVYVACLNRTSRSDERDDDHEGPDSIRLRKIKVAFEQKKNIIRRKRDADRLLALARKLQTPTKAEQIAAGGPHADNEANDNLDHSRWRMPSYFKKLSNTTVELTISQWLRSPFSKG